MSNNHKDIYFLFEAIWIITAIKKNKARPDQEIGRAIHLETHNNLEGFENVSGPSTTPSPTLDNLVELIATQNELFHRLFQGQ